MKEFRDKLWDNEIYQGKYIIPFDRAIHTLDLTLGSEIKNPIEEKKRIRASFNEGQIRNRAINNELLFDKINNRKKIIDGYSSYGSSDPKDSYWIEKSFDFLNDGHYKKAIEALSKASEKNPLNEDIWHDLGILYTRISNFPRALKCFDKALELNSLDSGRIWLFKGIIYYQLKNYKLAVEWFEKALTVDLYELKDIDILRLMGNSLYYLNHIDEAREIYIKIIKIDRNNAKDWYNMSVILRKCDRHSEADQALNKAFELDYNIFKQKFE